MPRRVSWLRTASSIARQHCIATLTGSLWCASIISGLPSIVWNASSKGRRGGSPRLPAAAGPAAGTASTRTRRGSTCRTRACRPSARSTSAGARRASPSCGPRARESRPAAPEPPGTGSGLAFAIGIVDAIGMRPVKAIQLASEIATTTLAIEFRHDVRGLGKRQPNDRSSANDATPTGSRERPKRPESGSRAARPGRPSDTRGVCRVDPERQPRRHERWGSHGEEQDRGQALSGVERHGLQAGRRFPRANPAAALARASRIRGQCIPRRTGSAKRHATAASSPHTAARTAIPRW
jgi:hypothetical protein